jgi:hypothetical protein
VVNCTPRPLYSRERNSVTIVQKLGGPQGRSGWVRKIYPPLGFDPRPTNVSPLQKIKHLIIFMERISESCERYEYFACRKAGKRNRQGPLHFKRLVTDYFYQQMHQDKFVTVFFIERVPQYVFRQLYCHHQGFF